MPHERKIYVDPLPPKFDEAPDRCTSIALFGTIMLALGCLRAPAQAVQANVPLKLKQGQVTIRDRQEVARLYAAREEEGFFGLGYATAEDRIDQVLLLYLGVKGELAAAFGPGPIGADKVGPMIISSGESEVVSARGLGPTKWNSDRSAKKIISSGRSGSFA